MIMKRKKILFLQKKTNQNISYEKEIFFVISNDNTDQ